LDLASAERRNEHELEVFVRDLGFAYMPNWLQVSRDSSFEFNGLDAGNLFSFSRATFDNMIDSLTVGLTGGSRDGALKVLPFQLGFAYRYHRKDQFAYLNFDYRYLPNYTPRFAMGYGFDWDEWELHSGLAYGGFNGLSWDLALSWKINSDWHLRGGLSNFFGIAVPTWSGGTIGNLGLRYIL